MHIHSLISLPVITFPEILDSNEKKKDTEFLYIFWYGRIIVSRGLIGEQVRTWV